MAAKFLAQEQTLHLADAVIEFAQRNGAGQLSVFVSKQQTPLWRSIITGQVGKLFFKVLKAEIDLEPGGILSEQLPRLLNFINRVRLDQFHANRSRTPERSAGIPARKRAVRRVNCALRGCRQGCPRSVRAHKNSA